MANDTPQPESRVKRGWGLFMGGVGSVSALIGLFVTLVGGVTWYTTHRDQHTESKAKMALAQTQANQGEYQASVQTYADILKSDLLYRPALDQQLNTTMLWTENFSVAVPEGGSASSVAGPLLDQIMPILDAGLTRAKGSQAADIQAHIGWAHWLNQHIAEREFGPAAERNLRAALVTDSSNVYANAMLGNWLLQNGGSFDEAVAHFHTAVATGKARPLVRAMQIGGLISSESGPGGIELIRAANDMRKDNEPLDERDRRRILFEYLGPSMDDQPRLVESLSAVPPGDALATYLWLDDEVREGDDARRHQFARDFVNANVLEISGQRPEALAKYQALRVALKNQSSTLTIPVNAAIVRLSHP